MKAVILAGGLGTRLSEETDSKPKPMVEIGGKPMLWHIMKIYSFHGVNDFIICCGYKGYVIKEYFANYAMHMSDVTFDFSTDETIFYERKAEPWRVTLIDTGDKTQTGGRLRRAASHIKDEKAFCFTYGDGLSDINIADSIQFHFAHGKTATVAAVAPPGRFGSLEQTGKIVTRFSEKPPGDGNLINGGFFVLSPDCLHLIENDFSAWEDYPMKTLADQGNLVAFEHRGFWQPMDTLREKYQLEKLWDEGRAPWKLWS